MPQQPSRFDLHAILDNVDRISLEAETSGDTTSADCLNYYYPILKQIQAEANATITTCDSVAASDRASALANVTNEKAAIDSLTGTVSTNLDNCKAETNALKALECYAVQVFYQKFNLHNGELFNDNFSGWN